MLEPFGAGNPRPVFETRGLRVMGEPQIIKDQHLKFRVAGDHNRPFEAIWWRGVEETDVKPQPNQRIDLTYEFEAQPWMGDIRLPYLRHLALPPFTRPRTTSRCSGCFT